ncbi:MAG: peptide transporter, partial [Methanobrevibacter sp.]|nr:peptide transporter [Methanobrevibacter sp.]
GLTVLYILVSRVFKLRKITGPKRQIKSKPGKADRVSASKKIDDSNKFKLSLGELTSFGETKDEINHTKRLTILYATLFVIWTLITILAVTRGSRFITTIVLPFGLLTGIFIGYATDYIKSKLNNDNWLAFVIILAGALAAYPLTQINLVYGLILLVIIIALGLASIYAIKSKKSASDNSVPIKKYIAIIAIVLALVSPTVCGAYVTAHQVVPGTSDPMWNSMVWINQNTDNSTVITSWWDFGYLFEVAADRQVTFDGGTQSGGRAFWLGQAMTSSDLEYSAGVFRMLDTSGTKAQEALYNYTQDYGKTTDILKEILPMTAENATNTLVNTYHLNNEQANTVVNYTHPENPRPVIFVASSDMLQKAGWWSYFGAWNFTNQSSQNYNYYVPTQQVTVEPGSTGKLPLIQDSGLIVNAVIQRGTGNNSTTAYTEALSTYNNSEIIINGTPYNPLNISNIIVIEDGYLLKNESVGNVENANYTLFLMGEDNVYTPILMDNHLANSMFTQLFLLGGSNQDVFTMV